MRKSDLELEETAAQMIRQERAVFVMTERQTGCKVGDKIPLKQKGPDLMLKCFRLMLTDAIESPQRLWLHWQWDQRTMKPVLGWEISKPNDRTGK